MGAGFWNGFFGMSFYHQLMPYLAINTFFVSSFVTPNFFFLAPICRSHCLSTCIILTRPLNSKNKLFLFTKNILWNSKLWAEAGAGSQYPRKNYGINGLGFRAPLRISHGIPTWPFRKMILFILLMLNARRAP